jgi:hypothetical protein
MYYVITLNTTYLYPYNVLYKIKKHHEEETLDGARIMARATCILSGRMVYILDEESNVLEEWALTRGLVERV